MFNLTNECYKQHGFTYFEPNRLHFVLTKLSRMLMMSVNNGRKITAFIQRKPSLQLCVKLLIFNIYLSYWSKFCVWKVSAKCFNSITKLTHIAKRMCSALHDFSLLPLRSAPTFPSRVLLTDWLTVRRGPFLLPRLT